MMKLFQHVNIQPCLAAFAADMEVGSAQAIDPLLHQEEMYLILSSAQE